MTSVAMALLQNRLEEVAFLELMADCVRAGDVAAMRRMREATDNGDVERGVDCATEALRWSRLLVVIEGRLAHLGAPGGEGCDAAHS